MKPPINPPEPLRSPQDGAERNQCVVTHCQEPPAGVLKVYCERHLLQRLKPHKTWLK